MTMLERGTPWAKEYTGSGRLTGQVVENPVRMSNGDVAPGHRWVGHMEETEFWEMAEAEQIRR